MKDLIEALTIFMSHGDVSYPTHCEHDIMYIYPKGPHDFTEAELVRLEELGFIPDAEFGDEGAFSSYRFGSC